MKFVVAILAILVIVVISGSAVVVAGALGLNPALNPRNIPWPTFFIPGAAAVPTERPPIEVEEWEAG